MPQAVTHFGYLARPPNERREDGGQVVGRSQEDRKKGRGGDKKSLCLIFSLLVFLSSCLLLKLTALDLLNQRQRLRIRCNPQLLGQHLTTAVGLGQGRGPLTPPGQDAHDTAVRRFQPRLQRQLALGGLERCFVITGAFGGGSQVGEGVQGLEMKLLLGDAPPLFKGIAIGNGKAAEEITPVEIDSLLQTRQTRLTGVDVAMAMGCAGSQ